MMHTRTLRILKIAAIMIMLTGLVIAGGTPERYVYGGF